MTEPIFICPECSCADVIVRAETAYKVNGGDFYCHSVKTQDDNARADCLACRWSGLRSNLANTA